MIELDPCASRTIKPRKPSKPCTRTVVAIDPRGVVWGEHGTYASFDEYTRVVQFLDPHLVICYSPETWLWKLHSAWQGFRDWSWRVVTTNKKGKPLLSKRVAYYGFRDPKKKHNRYHIVLDAGSFFRKQDKSMDDLLRLATDIRAFCNRHGVEVRASAAGIATQLLRHPRFYPENRRRVPHFINEDVRPHLPGGFYESYVDPGQHFDAALYIDQESAHHYAAQTTPLPNANSVRAIGYTKASERRYARKGRKLYERELQKHGLVKAHVRVPRLTPAALRFAPRVMHHEGERIAYLWTNEIPYLQSFGLDVLHLIAVWGTDELDKGITEYARWAQDVQREFPSLKALLLMPYGLLARHKATATFHHPGGTDTLILANQCLDNTRAHEVVTHPDTANALQLGLIQAFVRGLSLDMARQLSADNHEVVSIYADGVFVKLTKGKSIPMFAPWRVKGECELELTESLRVPARAKLRRDYLQMKGNTQHGSITDTTARAA